MTNFELMQLIILSKGKKQIKSILNTNRVSRKKSKYC